MRARGVVAAAAACVLACSSGTTTSTLPSGGAGSGTVNFPPLVPIDGGATDGGTPDGGTDGGPPDGGLPDGGGTDGGTAGDPCNGVPINGRCETPTSVSYCLVFTGGNPPVAMTFGCGPGETCQVTSSGRAECMLAAGTCREGAYRCTAAGDAIETCTAGRWSSSTCANGCNASPLGAFCNALPASSTETFSGTLRYEALVARTDHSDWDPQPKTFPARGLLVLSGYGDPQNLSNMTYVDLTTTGVQDATAGQYQVRVRRAADRGPEDVIMFATVVGDGEGGIDYMVANPAFDAPGEYVQPATGSKPSVWAWYAALDTLTGGDLVIPIDNHSAAVRIFDWMGAVQRTVQANYTRRGLPLVGWIQEGTTWRCGACFNDVRTRAFDGMFEAQVWFDGSTTDQGYWADSVTVHELGHWVMASYGTSPGEGGTHYFSQPTFPGMAWSEGFATWFGGFVRSDPLYLDKQGGTMVWFDIAARQYSGHTWQRPKAADGLLQRMDENEAAAMLWTLSGAGAAGKPILDGLASRQMNTSPWGRGYTRHTWTATPQGITNVRDTGEPAPCIADEFDAMMCAGFPAAAMDAATDPQTHYPYPSSSPICR